MDVREALQRISGGTLIIIAGFATGSVLEYGIKAVMARALQPAGYGAFIQAFATINVVTVIAVLGLHQSLPRFISYYRGQEQPSTVKSAVYTTALLALPATALATVLVYLGADTIAATVFQDPLMGEALRIMSFGMIPAAVLYLGIALLRGFQDAVRKTLISDVIHPVLQLGLVVVLLAAGMGVTGAAYAYVIAIILAAGMVVVAAERYVAQLDVSSGFIPEHLLFFSWPLLIVAVIVTMNKWVDVLMLGWLTTSEYAGIYEVAFAVAGFLLVFLSSLNYMFMPVISELLGAGNRRAARTVYQTTTRWLTLFSFPLFVGMLVFPEQILALLFGAAYVGGSVPLQLLAVGYFAAILTGPAGMMLLAAGHTKRMMIGLLVLGITDVVLNLLLIPRYGMTGAATGFMVAIILSNITLILFVYRTLDTHPFEPRSARLFLAAVLAVIPLIAVKQIMQPTALESVILGGGYVLGYGLLVLLLRGIDSTDRAVVRQLLQRAAARQG